MSISTDYNRLSSWRDGRAAYCAGFENQCAFGHRGFESPSLRFLKISINTYEQMGLILSKVYIWLDTNWKN